MELTSQMGPLKVCAYSARLRDHLSSVLPPKMVLPGMLMGAMWKTKGLVAKYIWEGG